MIADAVSNPVIPLFAPDHKRDAYGFSVRPQYVQIYREYVNIYKEEEEERSDRWNSFLEDHAESGISPANGLSEYNHQHSSECDKRKEEEMNKGAEGKDLHTGKSGSDLTTGTAREGDEESNGKKNVQLW